MGRLHSTNLSEEFKKQRASLVEYEDEFTPLRHEESDQDFDIEEDYFDYAEEDTVLQEGLVKDEGRSKKASLWGEKEGKYAFQASGKKKLSREEKQKAKDEKLKRQQRYGDEHLKDLSLSKEFRLPGEEGEEGEDEVDDEEWERYQDVEDKQKQAIAPIVKVCLPHGTIFFSISVFFFFF